MGRTNLVKHVILIFNQYNKLYIFILHLGVLFNFINLIWCQCKSPPAGTMICTVIGHAANFVVNCILLYASYSRNKYCLMVWMTSAAFVIICSPVPIIWATYIGLQVTIKVEKFFSLNMFSKIRLNFSCSWILSHCYLHQRNTLVQCNKFKN